jgi:hypothetical protein
MGWLWFLVGLNVGAFLGMYITCMVIMDRAATIWPHLKALAEIEAKAKALGGERNWRGKWVLRGR